VYNTALGVVFNAGPIEWNMLAAGYCRYTGRGGTLCLGQGRALGNHQRAAGMAFRYHGSIIHPWGMELHGVRLNAIQNLAQHLAIR
jgi:hypothetical protein